jgi:hypothetical protein
MEHAIIILRNLLPQLSDVKVFEDMSFLIRIISFMQYENNKKAAQLISDLIDRDDRDVITCMIERCNLLDAYREVICSNSVEAGVKGEIFFGLSNLVVDYHESLSLH